MGHQGAKSFVRVAEMLKLCPKHFPEGGDFSGVFVPPGCGPEQEWAINLARKQL